MIPARRLTWLVLIGAALATLAAGLPFVLTGGPGPSLHTSVRGEEVLLHGYGPYRHMPADVAVQGLAQDLVTLAVAVPFLLVTLWWARGGSRAGHLALCGAVGYLFVQYFLYVGMATYNEMFLLWVALVLVTSQALFRLLLAVPPAMFDVAWPAGARRFVGTFLLVNGGLVALLWLGTVAPPLLTGSLYPAGLAHFTTLVVQAYDLALFLPASLFAGHRLLQGEPPGGLLAPVYGVFLALQMLALLGKILWMTALGASAGPATIVIPLLFVGAVAAAVLSLRHQRGALVVTPPNTPGT